MKINYFGGCSFAINTKKGILLVDPQDEKKVPKNLIFTISTKEDDREEFASKPLVNWPGEYEYEGVAAKCFKTREDNLAHFFQADDIRVGFLGNLSKLVSQEKIEPLVNSDILFVSIIKDGVSSKELKKLIEEIDPRILIPYGDESQLSEFLKEMGADNVAKKSDFEVANTSLPSDHTDIVLLTPSY